MRSDTALRATDPGTEVTVSVEIAPHVDREPTPRPVPDGVLVTPLVDFHAHIVTPWYAEAAVAAGHQRPDGARLATGPTTTCD